MPCAYSSVGTRLCILLFIFPFPSPYPYKCDYKVKGIVRENIHKVVERGEKLDDLGDKAGISLHTMYMYIKGLTKPRKQEDKLDDPLPY